jgi:hypothetical protein
MNKLTKRYKGILILWLLVLTAPVFAQKTATQQEKEAAYTKVITQRSAKIVATLGISDSLKAKRVEEIIVSQYHNLSEIHDTRNEQVKVIKTDSTKSKEEKNTLLKKIDSERDAKLAKLHSEYLSKLSKELSQDQVDKVKDGMTYGKVQFTYNGYLQMILNLTDVQKKQILDWLIEARELAMDAGSSEEKTAIFGKYKGRIANYLSAQGYDLKKEQEERNKRIKDANAK